MRSPGGNYVKGLKVDIGKKEEEKICSLYNKGLTLLAICKMFGTHRENVKKILAKHNIELKWGKKIPESAEEDICKLYEKGYSIKSIGCKMSVSVKKVGVVLDAHNIPRRDATAYPRAIVKADERAIMMHSVRKAMKQERVS